LAPKRIFINIKWQSYYGKIDFKEKYIFEKDFLMKLTAKCF